MQINTDLLKNKQRIYIGGNHGVDEIFEIVEIVLKHIKKPADFYTIGTEFTSTDAPIVIMKGGDALHNGKAIFHQLGIHILLIHKIEEDIPSSYNSFDSYLAEFETLADNLPKAGCFLYFEDDDVALLMGKKEREDVKEIEYTSLDAEPVPGGFSLKTNGGAVIYKTDNDRFPHHAAGAKALLNRIGVSDDQFYSALKSKA
ncbi:hypothetical protein [Marinoscillum sp. 108]|uniref:hypothetical protein n=1 Tax=Marinoscillum sp. 108 TaxID=2653151 RepID=UPI00135C138D|nr:hypothetical protein [Marinoscillum sp. 108]